MRTTLDIDADILDATREMAARTRRTAGKIISELARQALTSGGKRETGAKVRNGFEVIPAGKRTVSAELVRKLKEEMEDS